MSPSVTRPRMATSYAVRSRFSRTRHSLSFRFWLRWSFPQAPVILPSATTEPYSSTIGIETETEGIALALQQQYASIFLWTCLSICLSIVALPWRPVESSQIFRAELDNRSCGAYYGCVGWRWAPRGGWSCSTLDCWGCWATGRSAGKRSRGAARETGSSTVRGVWRRSSPGRSGPGVPPMARRCRDKTARQRPPVGARAVLLPHRGRSATTPS